MSTTGRLLSVNVGTPRPVDWMGRTEFTSIWKSPVQGALAVQGVNVEGDDQADRSVHGGRDKAIYSYAAEDEAWWAEQLGREVGPGTFGENLTLSGIDVTNAIVGEQWQIGPVVLEVSQPRIPCWKLAARMNDPDFPDRFSDAGRPGAYLRIIEEGSIRAGDPVNVIYRPAHTLTVGKAAGIYHRNRDECAILLEVPELAEPLKRWARRRLGYQNYVTNKAKTETR